MPDGRQPVARMLGQDTPKTQRVWQAMDRLFSSEGVRMVGVRQLIADADVSKAAFYKHFISRENAVQLSVTARCQTERA